MLSDTYILEELHVSIIKVQFYIYLQYKSKQVPPQCCCLSQYIVLQPRLTAITWPHWSTEFIQSRETYLKLTKISNMKSTVI